MGIVKVKVVVYENDEIDTPDGVDRKYEGTAKVSA
jgi:hypothetical protein